MSITKNYQTAKGTYKVTFNFSKSSAPEAKSVVLLGDFNNWDVNSAPKMKAGKDAFSTSLELKAGTYEFRYFIDQIKWENDPSADNFVSSPFVGIHNSVISLPPVADKKEVKATAAKETQTTTKAKAPVTKTVATKAAKTEAKKAVSTAPAKVAAKATPVKVAATKPVAKKVAASTPTKVAAKATPVKVVATKPVATKIATAKPATAKVAAPKAAAPKKVVKTKASK